MGEGPCGVKEVASTGNEPALEPRQAISPTSRTRTRLYRRLKGSRALRWMGSSRYGSQRAAQLRSVLSASVRPPSPKATAPPPGATEPASLSASRVQAARVACDARLAPPRGADSRPDSFRQSREVRRARVHVFVRWAPPIANLEQPESRPAPGSSPYARRAP